MFHIRQRLNIPFCTQKTEAQKGTVAAYFGLFVGDGTGAKTS